MSSRPRAVLVDVDFTIAKPGPLLGPDGYQRAGQRHGLGLDPTLYESARATAIIDLRHHPELKHDEEIWIRFTEDIVRGMGGSGPGVSALAVEIVNAWEHSTNFELYEDVAPVFRELRRNGLRLCLVSNTSRTRLPQLIDTFSLEVDAWISSGAHGRVKPSPSIFRAALELLEVGAEDAVMVGDSLADDVAGARAIGIRAFLLDREGVHPDGPDVLRDLYTLPTALGL